MPWFYVDDNLAFHPKVLAAGNCAMGLWVRAGAWASGALTDGYIPPEMGVQMGTQKQVATLVDTKLWLKHNGGYLFHDWSHRQVSKVDIEARRISERNRKAEQRRRSRVPPGQPPWDTEPVDKGCPSGTGVRDSAPQGRGGEAHSGYLGEGSNGEYGEPPPPPHCHRHMPDGTSDPCRACGQARKQHEAWHATQTKTRAKYVAAIKADLNACPDCCGSGHILDANDIAIPCPRHIQQELAF